MAKAEAAETTVELPEDEPTAGTSLPPRDLPAAQGSRELATDADLAEYAGAGMEEARPEDQALPLLRILQSNSPEVMRGDERQVDGAEPGDIFDIVSGGVIKGVTGMLVIPVIFEPLLIEWKLRELGGGFVAQHAISQAMLDRCSTDDKGRKVTPHKTQLVDTKTWIVLRRTACTEDERGAYPETWEPGLLSLSSTQQKASRKWLSMAAKILLTTSDGRKVRGPLFACAYHLTTVPQRNEKGQWYGWDVAQMGRTTKAEIELSKALYEGFRTGKVKAKHEQPEGGDGGGEAGGDDVPF